MHKLVSVVVPVYNGEATVVRTIESILEQTYKSIEIVVVNDGSTDNTQELLETKFKSYDNIILVNKNNGGVSSARNLGVQEAKGSYISFLDADDTIEPQFVEKMIGQLIESESDFVYCGYNTVDNGVVTPQKINFTDNKLLKQYMQNKTHPASSCWLIKRNVLDTHQVKFREGINWSEDVEFYTKLLSISNKGSYVDEFLVNYYQATDDTRLSAFSIDKMDADYSSMMYILDNLVNDVEVEKVILDYRLNALLTFRLMEAVNRNIESKIVLEYYEKYSDFINKYSHKNGLRSIKLNLCTFKLKKKMKEMKAND